MSDRPKKIPRQDILDAHPIRAWLSSKGIEVHLNTTNACPIKKHVKPGHRPVSIDDKNNLWHCNDCGKGGSIIDWVILEQGITAKEALRMLSSDGPVSNVVEFPARQRPEESSAELPPLDWDSCVAALTDEHMRELAKERGYPLEAVKLWKERKLIGMFQGKFAFPISKNGAVRGIHVKVPGGKWFTHPGGNVNPIVIGELVPGKPVHNHESTWDGFDFLRFNPDCAVIISRGKTNGKAAGALVPKGSVAYQWPQNDEPDDKGEVASDRHLADFLSGTKETVVRCRVPDPHKDFNLWTRAGADALDVESAIQQGEVIQTAPVQLSLKEIVEADVNFLKRFIQFSNPSDALIVAYWCLASWFVDKLNYAPYLFITSPQPGCGKTVLLDCIELSVREPERAAGASAAYLFRLIEETHPTWLQDEIDTIWGEKNEGNEILRSVWNAGTRRRSAFIGRCGGPNKTTREKFNVFGFKAAAGIGNGLPETIRQRSFTIFLNKLGKNSKVEEAEDEIIVAAAPQNHQAKAAWAEATGKLDRVQRGPALQQALDPRQKECAGPLLSLAALTGQQAELERAIVANYSSSAAENDSDAVQLLADIREVIDDDTPEKWETGDMIDEIRAADLPSGSWWEPEKKPAAGKWIAKKLNPFRIFPTRWKESGKMRRGYLKSDLVSACSTYLPSLPSPASQVPENQSLVGRRQDTANDLF